MTAPSDKVMERTRKEVILSYSILSLNKCLKGGIVYLLFPLVLHAVKRRKGEVFA